MFWIPPKPKDQSAKGMEKACKFGDWNHSKSGVNLKEIESLMVDRGQTEQIKNQGPIWKIYSNQSF
jgi:hypothetical protein